MKFKGTDNYISTDDLSMAVNAAIELEKPLLIKGEPGTGKTMLAEEVAASLDMPLIEWHIKSTTKARQGLYEYDAVTRLRDSQLGDERVKDISNYIQKGKMWEAFASKKRVVLLVDEIDKADIEFPNDLLQEIDRMEFYVYETKETIKAIERPVVIITSNNEKELPDAFLRRCFFHYINFPDRATMEEIIKVHHPKVKKKLTAAFVRTINFPGKYYDDSGQGLFLFVSKSMAKSWVQRIHINGKRSDIGLGSADLVSLADARDLALSNRQMAKRGINPIAEKRTKDIMTFAAFGERPRARRGQHRDFSSSHVNFTRLAYEPI